MKNQKRWLSLLVASAMVACNVMNPISTGYEAMILTEAVQNASARKETTTESSTAKETGTLAEQETFVEPETSIGTETPVTPETLKNETKPQHVVDILKAENADDVETEQETYNYEETEMIDCEAIKLELQDQEYRENVTISDSEFIIIREDNDVDLKDEEWYQEQNITSYEALYTEKLENGTKRTVYKLTTSEDVWTVVDAINQEDSVVMAEPDYVYHTLETGTPSLENNKNASKEWYLDDLKMNTIWNDNATYGTTNGEGTVVAVIDTGVDYTHEDLKDNMWMNASELLGQEGVDDDGNGYVDDIYGISLIDGSSNPMDDNGHGTHVAGVIAMSDNSVGGIGIAYKSQIMAIKAGGADGSLNSSDIAKAIIYAASNGADVINMSFGSYAHSAIVESALQTAFSKCVLVAAAGNDSIPTLDAVEYMFKGNMYPAAYSYVIGVMACDSNNAITEFSNWDYKQNYGAEYEIVAPGKEIYSTLPGNRYASWSGTSMATPMVAATAAVVRSAFPDKNTYSSRYIMGQVVSATEDKTVFTSPTNKTYEYSKLNLAHSLVKSPKPNIFVDEVYLFDSTSISDKNNGDGVVQPGETIDIAIGYRNQWGTATDFYATVNATSNGGVVNPYVTFTNGNEVKLEDIGTFGTQNNGFIYDENNTIIGVSNPIRIRITEDAPNDANIQLNINYHAKNGLDNTDTNTYVQQLDTTYIFSVQKGKTLSGKITENMTLSKDEYYIIQNSLLIPQGITVTVEPGTQIQFWSTDSSSVYADTNIAYIQVEGIMNFEGSAEAPIALFPGKDFEAYRVELRQKNNGKINMDYVNIINPYITIHEGNHLNLVQDYDDLYFRDYDSEGGVFTSYTGARIEATNMKNSTVSNIRSTNPYDRAYVYGSYDTVQFENSMIQYDSCKMKNCTFLVNQGRTEDAIAGTLRYHTSQMNALGEHYLIPQYESYGIKEVNGKKYTMYKFNNYWYDNHNELTYEERAYLSYITLSSVIKKNGGAIASVDVRDKNVVQMLESYRKEINESWFAFNIGYYYDKATNQVVSANGEAILESFNMIPTADSPFSYITGSQVGYTDENGVVTYEYQYNYSLTNGLQSYYLVEFPTDTSDYVIQNPTFSIGDVDTNNCTAFVNNAILNRLPDKEINNWMKMTSMYDNSHFFIAKNNYWGTTDKALIQKQLIDFDTSISKADIVVEPYLETVSESTYPCVTDVYIIDKDGNKTSTVGNGEIEVHVLFNRDMNTTILPQVTYGPDDPYTDYVIEGTFVNSREWVGKATVKVLINQGQQYFRIKGAAAASDTWLTTGTDWGRFGFTIESTGAEALTLQGEGVENAIHLMWTQDDYETLAGFNVYRSATGEEGTYKKVNTSVIAPETKEYTDQTVDAGKKYHYYFTVVDTDLKESKPSNVIITASIDNISPVVQHTSLESYTYGLNASISATITDNVGINAANLYYKMSDETTYKSVEMVCTNQTNYSAQIPLKDLKIGTLQYYIEAADAVTKGYGASAQTPYESLIESKMALLSVNCEGAVVGKESTVIINGLNFTKDAQIYVDGKNLKVEYVSDKELKAVYIPEYLGQKKVELFQNNILLGAISNAFIVTDDTIKVFNPNQDLVVLQQMNMQQVVLNTNFKGKMRTLEIKYKVTNASLNFSCNYPWNVGTQESSDDNYTNYTFKYNNVQVHEGAIMSIDLSSVQQGCTIEIPSIKINGVEIVSEFDMNKITFVPESMYVPVETITIHSSSMNTMVGDSFTLDYSVSPANATKQNPIYSFDSTMLKQNEDGSFTALKSGTHWVNISVDGISQGTNINVSPIPVESIELEQYSYTGMAGNKLTIKANVKPLESDAYLNWWVSQGSDYVNVSSTGDSHEATIDLLKAGEAVISVGYGNVVSNINVTILENTIYASIEREILTLQPNQNHTVKVKLENQLGTDKVSLTWKSSNDKIATVDGNGKITAKSNGVAVISVQASGSSHLDTLIVIVGTDSMSYALGDINMDGTITSVDAMLALKLSLNSDTNEIAIKMGDVNADGILSSTDAMLILQYVTGKIKEF